MSAVARLAQQLYRALTADRVVVCARLLVHGHSDGLKLAEPWAGDDAWSIGCRGHSFSRKQLHRVASTGRYNWLSVLDETYHFIFLIEGVPVRFFRGVAPEPSKRSLWQQESEAQQLAPAPGAGDAVQGLMSRLPLEIDEAGVVNRVMFLAFRGEEGRVDRYWPVLLECE